MSDSDWRDNAQIRGLIAAAGAIAFLALLAVIISSVQYERDAHHAASGSQQQEYSTETLLRACRGLDEVEQAPTTEQCEEARDYADLDAQQNMVVVGGIQVAVGIFGLIGLIATVHFARKAWKEAERGAVGALDAAKYAKESADIARRELTERNRPRLFVTITENKLWGQGNYGYAKPGIEYLFTNVGEHTAHIETGWFEYRINAAHPEPGAGRTKGRSFPRIDEEHALMPGKTVRVDAHAGFYFEPDEFPVLNLGRYEADFPVVKALGFIHYRDHLGTKRIYEFCFVCLPPNFQDGAPGWDWMLYNDDRERRESDEHAVSRPKWESEA